MFGGKEKNFVSCYLTLICVTNCSNIIFLQDSVEMTTPHIPDCVTCGGNEFSNDDGFYYCQECGTKAADAVELNYELTGNYANVRLKKLNIPKPKSAKKKGTLQ